MPTARFISRLRLTAFRNYQSAALDLDSRHVVLVGPNGRGKTNLLEAIGYLATLGSHRVATDAPLVRHGCERALVQSDGLPWPVYDRFCARWVKRIGARKHYPNPPPDIELKPEIDEDDKATLRRMGAKRAAKSGRDSLR